MQVGSIQNVKNSSPNHRDEREHNHYICFFKLFTGCSSVQVFYSNEIKQGWVFFFFLLSAFPPSSPQSVSSLVGKRWGKFTSSLRSPAALSSWCIKPQEISTETGGFRSFTLMEGRMYHWSSHLTAVFLFSFPHSLFPKQQHFKGNRRFTEQIRFGFTILLISPTNCLRQKMHAFCYSTDPCQFQSRKLRATI